MPKKRLKGLKLPRFALVFYGVAAFSLAVWLLSALSTPFAEFINGRVGGALRAFLAWLTSPLPFSLAEVLLLLLPLVLFAVGVLAYRKITEWRDVWRFLLSLVSVFSILFSLFVFTIGAGHRVTPLDRRLGLTADEVTAAELTKTAKILVEKVNGAANHVAFGDGGFSKMPYDIQGLNERLLAAYVPATEKYPFIGAYGAGVKPVMLSRAMSYTHITGVYSYYTGEANLNVYFPDYTLPFTAAHEMAHQRGMAREEEANFVAFLVLSESTDPYLQYSGYLNLLEYVGSALYRADREAYLAVMGELSSAVLAELRAYAAFFRPLSDSAASKVSDTVNDAYLKLNGNEAGTASYGLVVDLAVAYYSLQTTAA